MFGWFDMTDDIMNTIYSILAMLDSLGYERLNVGLAEFNPGMFATVVQIAEVVIRPIALSLLTLFLMLELLEILKRSAGNGGITLELMIPFLFKFALSYTLVTQAIGLLTGIFNLALTMIRNISVAVGSQSEFLNLEATRAYIGNLGFGGQINLWAVVLIVSVIVTIGGFIVNIKITMRMIEIYGFLALSPLPLSTFAGGESSQMGKSFLKNFSASCTQGVVMLVFLNLASAMFMTLGLTTDTSTLGQMWGMAGFMILLIFAIMASESTAKKAIGAM